MENKKLSVTDLLILINIILIAVNYFILDGNIKVSITIAIITVYIFYRRIQEIKDLRGKGGKR